MIAKLATKEVEFMPEQLEQGILYVSRKFGLAIHLCACGCGIKTVTPSTGHDCWTLTDSPEGITLRPSIGNQNFPCKSHYWITNNEVQPC